MKERFLIHHGSWLKTVHHSIKPSYKTKPAIPGLQPGQLRIAKMMFLCTESGQNSPEEEATLQGIATDQWEKAQRRWAWVMWL